MRQETNPVYIYAPAWRDTAAGIKVLHLLCHRLNSNSIPTWMVIERKNSKFDLTNPDLNTPILTKANRDFHFKQEKIPIVIYPETIIGNPLQAKFVIRYALNYSEAFGKISKRNKSFAFEYCYSADLKQDFPNADVLWIPSFHLNEIPRSNEPKISLLYAGKYRALIGIPPILKQREDLIEIYRSGRKKQSREAVMHLLSIARCLFLYENSMLSLEARLAGVPVVELRSELNERSIGKDETGTKGICNSDSDAALDIARKELQAFRSEYQLLEEKIDGLLKSCYVNWLDSANSETYSKPIQIPRKYFFASANDFSLGLAMMKKFGIFKTLKKVLESKFKD